MQTYFTFTRAFKIILSMGLVSGCATIGEEVTSEAKFRQHVVDRELSWPGGYNVRFHSNGVISGKFPEGPVIGSWVWRNGQFCRQLSVGSRQLARECLTIELREKQVRFRRNSGRYFNPYNIAEQ